MYVNYVVGDRRSEALLRGSTHGYVGLGIVAQEGGIVLLIADGPLQTVAHGSLSLSLSFSLSLFLSHFFSLSLAASCQLCRSLARRIRASTPIAIPLPRPRASDYRIPCGRGDDDDDDDATATFDIRSAVLLAISPGPPLAAARHIRRRLVDENSTGDARSTRSRYNYAVAVVVTYPSLAQEQRSAAQQQQPSHYQLSVAMMRGARQVIRPRIMAERKLVDFDVSFDEFLDLI